MTVTITLIGGPTALIEIDGFRQRADDLRATFDTLGFGSRLRILEPGVATVIETPRAT
jgi:hypothetical protein